MTNEPDVNQHEHPIDRRVQVSALWTAMLFIFVYVDLFSLYRPDVRAHLESGKLAAYAINQSFLLSITLYVVIPSLMIYVSLVLRRRLNRILNLVVAAVYALTIAGGAIGEWNYYLLGSAVEVVLLLTVARTAWTWPATTRRVLAHDRRRYDSSRMPLATTDGRS